MTTTTSEDQLRYPIGRYTMVEEASQAERARWMADVAELPARLRGAVDGFDAARLDTPYRPGGWTVRQLVHHMSDSHMNAYIRFKLALTEDSPTIKPYDEGRWVMLADTQVVPVETSVVLVEALHERWSALLEGMAPGDFARTFVHPDHGKALTLDNALGMYAWHGRHHVAHITALREREGW